MRGRDMRSSVLDHRYTYRGTRKMPGYKQGELAAVPAIAPVAQNEALLFHSAGNKQGLNSREHLRTLYIQVIHRDSRTSQPHFCIVNYSLCYILPHTSYNISESRAIPMN